MSRKTRTARSSPAAAFVAAVGDPRRFANSGQLASYLGLTPSTYDSGERERHGHITKRGPSYLRSLLCEAAQHARRIDHPLNPSWRRLSTKGGDKKAIVAVAHRLARILWRMWRDQRDFDVACLNVVYDPGTVTRPRIDRLADSRHGARRSDPRAEESASRQVGEGHDRQAATPGHSVAHGEAVSPCGAPLIPTKT